MLATLLNGISIMPHDATIHADDRGLLYGDGLFESMSLRHGQVKFFNDHLQRLYTGMERLKIYAPEITLFRDELQQLIHGHRDGVVKLIVTRGRGERGYRATAGHELTRLWQLFEPVVSAGDGIAVRWCNTRLARNPLLSGIKHLNRLEQVLAQSEWQDADIAEGLLMDTEGELISGTMSNVFMVINDVLVTPDLRYCGVLGVMRKNVLYLARDLHIETEERAVRPEELSAASEVFITNAIRGIRPVITLSNGVSVEPLNWSVGNLTTRLMQKLDETVILK